jgi:hypothetical protein
VFRESVIIDAGTPASFPSGNANTETPTRTQTPLVPQARVALNEVAAIAPQQSTGIPVGNGKMEKI